MKKTVLLILSLAFIITATACGTPDIPEPATPGAQSEESVPAPEVTPTSAPDGPDALKIITGDNKYVVTMDDIIALKPNEVLAYPRDEERRFAGVSLISIFEQSGVDYSNMESVVFTAADGFDVKLTAEEVLNTENTFIVIAEDDEPLGHWTDDGSGPFMVVLAEDPFPNRWVKHLVEITIIADENCDCEFEGDGFVIITDSGNICVGVDDILSLKTVTATWFDEEYKGVPVVYLFEHLNIGNDGSDEIIFRAADGYPAVVSISEALDPDNAIIAFEAGGEPIVEEGKFALVLLKDTRQSRFVRELKEVELITRTGDAADLIAGLGDYEFAIVAGKRAYVVSMDDMHVIGGTAVSAQTRDAVRTFEGVSLVKLLNHLNIDYSSFNNARITSLDGFESSMTAEEAFNTERAYIVFEEDGAALGHEADDGIGPFMSILLDAPGNRWIRHLQVIALN